MSKNLPLKGTKPTRRSSSLDWNAPSFAITASGSLANVRALVTGRRRGRLVGRWSEAGVGVLRPSAEPRQDVILSVGEDS
jgi:hypothetical protein